MNQVVLINRANCVEEVMRSCVSTLYYYHFGHFSKVTSDAIVPSALTTYKSRLWK